MLNLEEITLRLKDVDPMLCAAFAARCSLRVLPILVANQKKEIFWYWNKEDRSKHILDIFMAQQVSINVSYFSGNTESYYFATSIDVPSDTSSNAESSLVYSVANSAAYATINANTSDTAHDAAFAAAFASIAARTVNIESEILSDLDKITKNLTMKDISLVDFIYSPLWSAAIPKRWEIFYTRFIESVIALEEGFEIWVKWYEDRLKSLPMDREQEEKWLNIPVEIRDQGPKATNAYLTSLVIDQQVNSMKPLNLVRAIFIGNGAAGKTSLIRRLYNEPVLEGKEEMTPGIQIREWPVPETDIKARFWDFGGQVMSHSTHQFFLRERCLYVLVVDAGSEREIRENQTANDQAEYWLEHVKAFGNGAPVMIVGNKSDVTAINLDMNALRENYPNIIEFYPVSCISHESSYVGRFNVFRDDLSEHLKAVGTHQVMFTLDQFKVLKKIQQLSRKNAFLDHDEFDGLCKQYEIGKVGLDQQAFLGLLDSLGEIIHFPELEWSDAYVLNPRWLTYGVYTLLYSDKAKVQQGVLSHADVISILQAQTVVDENGNQLAYPKEKCRFIIDAMSNFKLCYCLPEDSRYFVIPDKLPKEQPNLRKFFDKNLEGTLAFEFDFSGFLPRNIMPNLIVSRHREIMINKLQHSAKFGVTSFLQNLGKKLYGSASSKPIDSEDQQVFKGEQLVWQRGVIFYNQTHQSIACIQVDYHKRSLRLWIQEHEAREYLVILRDEIYNIINAIKGLSVKENVIMPDFARTNIESLGLGRQKIEKAPYNRLLQEAKLGQEITVSDAGNQYDLKKVMGFIMTEEQQKKEGVNIIYNIETVGAMGGIGDYHSVSGKVILGFSDKRLVSEFQESISRLMDSIEKHDADFKLKSQAYNELQQINDHLDNLENVSPETKSKLQQLLINIKDGSLGALQLAKDIKDSDDTVVWLMEKAALVSALLVASPVG